MTTLRITRSILVNSQLGAIAAGACLAACASGDDPAIQDHSAKPSPVEEVRVLSIEETEAEFQRRVRGTLTDEEHSKILDVLAAFEAPSEQVKLVGRMVVWDDVYLDGEELMVSPETLIEKGRVLTVALPGTAGTPGPTPQLPIAPHRYAQVTSGGVFQFWRPAVEEMFHAIVVPNSPSFLLTLASTAANNIGNADSDCLFGGANGTLRAMTKASWDGMGPGQSVTPRTFVVYGPRDTACPGLLEEDEVSGCALAPRLSFIKTTGGVSVQRMLIGPRLGFVDTDVTGNNANSLRIVTHEILHSLGLAHPNLRIVSECTAADLSAAGCTTQAACCNPVSPQGGVVPRCCAQGVIVPGTNIEPNHTSIMTGFCPDGAASPGCSNTMTNADIDLLDTLYSPQAGGSCAYVHNFTTIIGD